jgi:ATP adenylyltransferase
VKIAVKAPGRPLNGGHLIVETDKPIFDMDENELTTLKKVLDTIITIEKQKLKPEGFNIYISAVEVHLLPRWCGDMNVAFFGGLKVVPLSRSEIEKMAEEISKALHP